LVTHQLTCIRLFKVKFCNCDLPTITMVHHFMKSVICHFHIFLIIGMNIYFKTFREDETLFQYRYIVIDRKNVLYVI